MALHEGPSTLILSFGTAQNVPTGSIYARSRPDVDECLHGRTAFYRALEQGLNVSYCSPSLDASFQDFVDASFESGRTAYDRMERQEIAAYVLSPAALRDRLGSIRLLYCEPDCTKGLHLLQSELTIISNALHTENETALPRRFNENDMSLAITDRIWLLYRLPDSRMMAIRIGSASQAEELRRFLTVDAPAITERIFSDAEDKAFVSGTYSGETGGAGNERLILSSRAKPVKQNILVNGNTYKMLLFAESSIVLRRNNPAGFRFQSVPEIQLFENGSMLPLKSEDYQPENAVPGRVAIRGADEHHFARNGICLWSSPCSPEDIPIRIAAMIEAQRLSAESLSYCNVDDLTVEEINPFGLILTSDSQIQIGGKFIEFKVSRRCANRSLYLKQNDWIAGFPDILEQGMFVLTADRSFFDIPVVESTLLRRLIPAPFSIADANKTKTIEIDENSNWIYGSSDGLRSVHSLLHQNPGILYHGMTCAGLRPDLCVAHAMTPGFSSTSQLSFVEAQISEILPYLDGRFIELYCRKCTGDSGRIDLFIRRLSDDREDHYVLPQAGKTTLTLTPSSTCGHQSNRFSDLYIPASSAVYRTGVIDLTGAFQQSDLWQIDTATYNLLRREKRSLSRTRDGVLMTEKALSGCEIRATPGIAEFEP